MTQAVSAPLALPATRARIHPLVAVLIVAAVIRLPLALMPNVHMPDEIFQVLEPAWRLLGRDSIISWEWRDGIRSWFLPALMAGPAAFGEWLAPGGLGAFVLPRLTVALASLSIVATAYLFGARTSQAHGTIAGLVAAIWFELVFFAPHTLSEPIATAAILPAAYLLASNRPSQRQLLAAGALLGFAFIVRFHYAPAMVVLVAGTCWKRWRCLLPLAAGGCTTLVVAGIVDAACGATPFAWIVQSVRHNIMLGRAASFGVEPATAYLAGLLMKWSVLLIPLVVAIANGTRHAPVLLWMAIVNIAVHSAIGHKEYRFIFLSVASLLILAAIGTVDWIARLRAMPSLRRAAAPTIMSAWLVASAALALAPGFREQWTRGVGAAEIGTVLRNDPATCGVALFETPFFVMTGRERLAGSKPIFNFALTDKAAPDGASAALDKTQAGFNRIVARRSFAPAIPVAFAQTMCVPLYGEEVCVYARRGTCDIGTAANFDLNASLARLGL